MVRVFRVGGPGHEAVRADQQGGQAGAVRVGGRKDPDLIRPAVGAGAQVGVAGQVEQQAAAFVQVVGQPGPVG